MQLQHLSHMTAMLKPTRDTMVNGFRTARRVCKIVLRGATTRHRVKGDFAHAAGLSCHVAIRAISKVDSASSRFAVVDRVRKIALTLCCVRVPCKAILRTLRDQPARLPSRLRKSSAGNNGRPRMVK